MREMYKTASGIVSDKGVTGDQTVYGFGIYNGSTGNTGSIGVVTHDGQEIQFQNVAAGTILPVHHQKIFGLTAAAALKTTCTNLISLI